jgi:hypothetical protein
VFKVVASSAVVTALCGAVFGAAIGCGGAAATGYDPNAVAATEGEPEELKNAKTFFIPGEMMTFELALRDITGGEATLVVGDPGEVEGKRVIIVRSSVESTGVAALIKEVRDDVTSWIDLDTSQPIYYHADLLFGEKTTIVETSFGSSKFVIDYERNGKPGKKQQRVPADQQALDAHSALGALRAWNPVEGDSKFFYGLSGRRLWRVDMRYGEREAVKTSMGTNAAIRYDGVAQRLTGHGTPDKKRPARSWSIWISDDANRVPLLIVADTKYGKVTVELVDYYRPERKLGGR